MTLWEGASGWSAMPSRGVVLVLCLVTAIAGTAVTGQFWLSLVAVAGTLVLGAVALSLARMPNDGTADGGADVRPLVPSRRRSAAPGLGTRTGGLGRAA